MAQKDKHTSLNKVKKILRLYEFFLKENDHPDKAKQILSLIQGNLPRSHWYHQFNKLCPVYLDNRHREGDSRDLGTTQLNLIMEWDMDAVVERLLLAGANHHSFENAEIAYRQAFRMAQEILQGNESIDRLNDILWRIPFLPLDLISMATRLPKVLLTGNLHYKNQEDFFVQGMLTVKRMLEDETLYHQLTQEKLPSRPTDSDRFNVQGEVAKEVRHRASQLLGTLVKKSRDSLLFPLAFWIMTSDPSYRENRAVNFVYKLKKMCIIKNNSSIFFYSPKSSRFFCIITS